MSIAMDLENLALGEVTLEEGSKTVRAVLSRLDRDSASSLYEALRSWTWKALEARRRDDELPGWMDMLSRASSHIESISSELSVKIEAFIELLHASVMTAAVAAERDPLERKHVRAALSTIYRFDGRMRRRDVMTSLRLKAANLSRIMTPLLDDGYVVREVDGREIFYRLTVKGRGAVSSAMAHERIVFETGGKSENDLAKITAIFSASQTDCYRAREKDRPDLFVRYPIRQEKTADAGQDYEDWLEVAVTSHGGAQHDEEKQVMRVGA